MKTATKQLQPPPANQLLPAHANRRGRSIPPKTQSSEFLNSSTPKLLNSKTIQANPTVSTGVCPPTTQLPKLLNSSTRKLLNLNIFHQLSDPIRLNPDRKKFTFADSLSTVPEYHCQFTYDDSFGIFQNCGTTDATSLGAVSGTCGAG